MDAKLYLGVDGGGTHCRMRLADSALATLGEAKIERKSNLQVDDGDSAYSAVIELTGMVFRAAGLLPETAARTYACFGMAGARLESARAAFETRAYPFARVKVYDDIDIARSGALLGEDGAALIVGTGSAGLAVIGGKRHQIGGWGFHVGDTMSGAILGRELLRISLLAHEGLRPATPLTRAAMARFKSEPNELMGWSFSANGPDAPARPADFGEYAPMVLDYLDRADPVALELLEFELAAIDQYVDWFRTRGAKVIAVVGGLGGRLYPRLVERYGEIIAEPKSAPLDGALILARQLFADA
ncbi:MAG: BadF/BadG/BcrA/BcrD ATPase family protein [Cucumibacter sp.]